jgi:hypothetical protein
VQLSPRQVIVPLAPSNRPIRLSVDVLNNNPLGADGTLTLHLPSGWRSEPPQFTFRFMRSGERSAHEFSVTPDVIGNREYSIEAVARVDGRDYRDGYEAVEHRDLETRHLYRPAAIGVRGIDVKLAHGIRVGYVMGVGDEVPAGIAQVGASVQLLGPRDLSGGDLGGFDTIVTGTRAYGIRDDLRTHNHRLLEYVRNGGNMIVLYNTPAEFDPAKYAPFPASLPANAEEVSEEDSPVRILTPDRPELTTPNAITSADFEGWVEQRGSKFLSQWDIAYVALIETQDTGQSPQRGGWVTARYGKGHYTYFAYALHRQLPYGVPGAYRILANLLSLSVRDGGRQAIRVERDFQARH